MSIRGTIPEKFQNKVPIKIQQLAVEILRGHPLKNTKQFLQIEGDVAWIEVEVYSREVGNHSHTNHYQVDLGLAQALVDQGVVVKKWHPVEAGGERLELNEKN